MEELEKKLVTDRGFIDEFWSRVSDAQLSGHYVTHIAVFEELNGIYESAFGEPKFPSYDAFRMRRDRHRDK